MILFQEYFLEIVQRRDVVDISSSIDLKLSLTGIVYNILH